MIQSQQVFALTLYWCVLIWEAANTICTVLTLTRRLTHYQLWVKYKEGLCYFCFRHVYWYPQLWDDYQIYLGTHSPVIARWEVKAPVSGMCLGRWGWGVGAYWSVEHCHMLYLWHSCRACDTSCPISSSASVSVFVLCFAVFCDPWCAR